MSLRFKSIRSKVVALVIAVVLLTSIAFGLRNHLQTRKLLTDAVVAQLEASARAEAVRFAAIFKVLERDAVLLSRTPPIKGIIRARSGSGVDPLDGSTTRQWSDRLARIFEGLIEARPTYAQIRYIGMADTGRELVRVERRQGDPYRVDEANLQQKGREPYMAALRGQSGDSAFYSDVTENREHGRVEGPGTPMLRIVQPVFDDDQELFGAVVVNVDYSALLLRAEPSLRDHQQLVVLNDAGDYIAFDGPGVPPEFHFHLDETWRPLIWGGALPEAGGGPGVLRTRDRTAFQVPIPLEAGMSSSTLWVIASADNADLFAGAARSSRLDLAVGVLTGTVMVALAVFVATGLTRPLEEVASALSRDQPLDAIIALHVDTPDEIGTVARAFRELSDKLFESTARTRAVYQHAPAGIITFDETELILDMNPMAEEMFGYGPGAAEGQPIENLVPIEHRSGRSRCLAALQELNGNTLTDRTLTGLRRDGSRFPVSVSLSRVSLGGTVAVIAIVQDITERYEAERKLNSLLHELERSKRELERSNDELDRYAHVASHDLKAPLRVIDNASKWLEEDLEPYLDDDTRESMKFLRSRVARMERLLDALLDYSRVGKAEEPGELITGTEIMERVLSVASPPKGMDVECGVEFEDVRLPRTPISNVLINLVSNAIKHHDRERGLVRVTVEDGGVEYRFAVEDDGPGIPVEYHEIVFDMFQTLKPRDEVEGSGMGLAFVRKAVESVNGTLTLESENARGSVFRFTWPKASADSGGFDAA